MKSVLIGFSCAYKTCAGKILAEKLGYNFIDTDKTLERRTGMSVAEIFARNGEERFREEENALLYELAESNCDNAVIACGGGSPLCSGFRALACNAAVVWLTVGVDYVLSRLRVVTGANGRTFRAVRRVRPFNRQYRRTYFGANGGAIVFGAV